MSSLDLPLVFGHTPFGHNTRVEYCVTSGLLVAQNDFSQVFHATRKPLPATAAVPVYIKVYGGDDRSHDAYLHERAVLGEIEEHSSCPYLPRALEWFEDEETGRPCIVFQEWGPSLMGRLEQSGSACVGLNEVSLWAYQLVVALDELHGLGITHCDVQPANVIITDVGGLLLHGCALAIGRSHGEPVLFPGVFLNAGNSELPPEIRKVVHGLQQSVEVTVEVESALEEALYKELADAKWDLWMFARTLLAALVPETDTLGVRWLGGDSYDLYNLREPPGNGWWPASNTPAREALYQIIVRGGRCQGPRDGSESRVLYSIVDAILGCLRPSPGARFSATDVKATLLSPQPALTGVLGDYYLATDLVPVDANGREARFVRPFANGFFGDVFCVRIGRSNVSCVMKTTKHRAHAEDMLEEIRLVCQLRSEHIVAYLGAVYEDEGGGRRTCGGFLMERMEEDLLTHLRRAEYHTGDPPDGPTSHCALGLLLDIAEGLRAIHGHAPPIVHRDLHIRNVLVTRGRAKLSDFGCGKAITPDVVNEAQGQTCMPGFIPIVPPEARNQFSASSTPPSVSYDVYGYGLLTAQVLHSLFSVAGDRAWEELRSEERWKREFVGKAQAYACMGGLARVGRPLENLLCTCVGEWRQRPTAAMLVATVTHTITTLRENN